MRRAGAARCAADDMMRSVSAVAQHTVANRKARNLVTHGCHNTDVGVARVLGKSPALHVAEEVRQLRASADETDLSAHEYVVRPNLRQRHGFKRYFTSFGKDNLGCLHRSRSLSVLSGGQAPALRRSFALADY